MMRFCFVSTVRVYRTSTILCALLCLAVALLVACGGRETSPSNSVDLAVVGQTVTKVRTAGNEVVVASRSDLHPSLRTVHSARWRYCKATATPCSPTCRLGMVGGRLRGASVRRHFGNSHHGYGSAHRSARSKLARFEATNYFSTPPPQPIHSSTMPEVSRMTTLFSLH